MDLLHILNIGGKVVICFWRKGRSTWGGVRMGHDSGKKKLKEKTIGNTPTHELNLFSLKNKFTQTWSASPGNSSR